VERGCQAGIDKGPDAAEVRAGAVVHARLGQPGLIAAALQPRDQLGPVGRHVQAGARARVAVAVSGIAVAIPRIAVAVPGLGARLVGAAAIVGAGGCDCASQCESGEGDRSAKHGPTTAPPGCGYSCSVSERTEPIADGAWMLALDTPTLPPATATNTLILGGDRLLIVEPATPHPRERARVGERSAALRAEGRALAGVIVTHHHVDHVGYAEARRDAHDIPIHAHPQTASRLEFAVDREIDDGWT